MTWLLLFYVSNILWKYVVEKIFYSLSTDHPHSPILILHWCWLCVHFINFPSFNNSPCYPCYYSVSSYHFLNHTFYLLHNVLLHWLLNYLVIDYWLVKYKCNSFSVKITCDKLVIKDYPNKSSVNEDQLKLVCFSKTQYSAWNYYLQTLLRAKNGYAN